MSASFEQWVQAVFDHEPAKEGEEDWSRGASFDEFWESLGLSEDLTVTLTPTSPTA
jgi:hypothetical protein